MKILEIYPKDFYITVELSLREVHKILVALDGSALVYNGKKPEEKEAVEFVKDNLYPMLERLYEENKQYDS